jgi:hypothetical protein
MVINISLFATASHFHPSLISASKAYRNGAPNGATLRATYKTCTQNIRLVSHNDFDLLLIFAPVKQSLSYSM